MTPQERDLLTNLVTRLRQSPPQQRDVDAEAMINDLVREKPDTPYILAQTVLIQDYALHQAQSRIADLEQQLQGQPAQESGGFLSAIFGSGKPPAQRPQPQLQYQQPQYQQPAYAPQPSGGPWGQAPQGYAPQGFASQGGYAPSGQPSFLRSAATTAAGIAGGALLFQGIESLIGGHGGYGGGFGGGGFGGAGFTPQPGITETVVNNYYGGDGRPGGTEAGFDTAAASDRDAGFTDAGFDDGGFDNSRDFSGDDSI
jgi:hypothetical protein